MGSKNSDAARNDVYDVECGTKTKSLNASVMDLATQPEAVTKIGVQITKGTYHANGPAVDITETDALYSDWVTATPPNGQGHYNMSVNKSRVAGAKGAELFKVRFVCVDANGKRTETQAELKQNQ